MNAKRTTPSEPALLWSREGRVCCPQHAPYPKSDSWRHDGWRRMRNRDIAAFAVESGQPVECEVCGPRALVRRAEAGR